MLEVVTVQRSFRDENDFIKNAKDLASQIHTVSPTVILFHEGVLGTYPITPEAGRKIAGELHRVAASKKNLYFAYSLFEVKKNEGRRNLLANRGYLITPEKHGTHGYLHYPKLLTYTEGTSLSRIDLEALKRVADWKHRTDLDLYIKDMHRRSQGVKGFPRLNIGGHEVSLKICLDSGTVLGQDIHPAMKSRRKSDLVIVPAKGLFPQPDYAFPEHIKQTVRPSGLVVVSDKDMGTLVVRPGKKDNLRLDASRVSHEKPHEHGRIRVRHIK